MYSLNFMGQTITCETAGEVVDLVYETARKASTRLLEAVRPQTKPTTTRATTTGKKKPTKKATLKARAAQARESYKAKQEASRQAHKDEQKPTTTAETHHGEKPKRAATSGAVIATLRRSGLPLTISEIQGDLQKAGWKYRGTDPKGTIRATLNRLVGKDEVAKGRNNGDITFAIARVEHADPLPHEQRETD